MAYKVLKSFKGSPDGRFAIEYAAGSEVDLTDSLAEVALAEGWVEPVTQPDEAPAAPAPKTRKKTAKE